MLKGGKVARFKNRRHLKGSKKPINNIKITFQLSLNVYPVVRTQLRQTAPYSSA